MIIALAVFALVLVGGVIAAALASPFRRPKALTRPQAWPPSPDVTEISRGIVERKREERATSASGFTAPTRPAAPVPQRFNDPPPNLVVAPVVDPLTFAPAALVQTQWHDENRPLPGDTRSDMHSAPTDYSGQTGSFSGAGASSSWDPSPSYAPPIHDAPSYSPPPSFDSSFSCDSSSSSCGSFD